MKHTNTNISREKRRLTIEIKQQEQYIKDMQSTRRNNADVWWYLGDKITIYHVQSEITNLEILKIKRNKLNNK